jgi:Kef-type K+ transport system membrane component KefB
MDDSLQHLFLVAMAVMLAPLISDLIPGIRIPVVILEIVLGILIGPDLLDLAEVRTEIAVLAELGLAFLFFLAGFEIDLERIKGKPLRLAVQGWLIGVALALFFGAVLQATGQADSFLFVGLAMATTAVGTLMPILSDEGLLKQEYGTQALAIGAVGEFGPIILIALLLDPHHGGVASALILNTFLIFVLGLIVLTRRWNAHRLAGLVVKTIDSSGQFAIRITMFLIIGLAYVANELDLEFLLGAFAAGAIIGQAAKRVPARYERELETVREKFDAIGYGLLIPIFFVATGIQFQLRALLGDTGTLMLVPLFLLLFLLVRGLPILRLYRADVPIPEERLSLGILASTQLPVVIAITTLGVEAGRMSVELATAMVGAAMLSVLLFPLIGLALQKRQAAPERMPA